MSAGLRARGLRIGQKHSLLAESLDLMVPAGQLVALLGANGAGKSTLLRSLAQLLPPLAGRVEVDGVDLACAPPKTRARLLAVALTERPELSFHTAQSVVALARRAHLGWGARLTAEDAAAVAAALEAVGAAHLAQKDMSTLSDGECQRVMIARAVAQEPRVLLLDEPAAFLDLPAKADLWAAMRTLARARGMAVVLSSHDPEFALRAADQIWLIDAERRFHQGTPAELIASGTIARAFASPYLDFRADAGRFDLRLPCDGGTGCGG